MGFPDGINGKKTKNTVNAGDIRDAGSIPRLGRSPGEGHGNLPHYSCLANPMGKTAWWATVHRGHKELT